MATAAINTRMRRERTRPGKIVFDAPKPTAWEKFLERIGTTTEQAVRDIRRGCGGHAYQLRQWVRDNYLKAVIPEEVLEAAKLRHKSDSHW